jgi:hypothetical protein
MLGKLFTDDLFMNKGLKVLQYQSLTLERSMNVSILAAMLLTTRCSKVVAVVCCRICSKG